MLKRKIEHELDRFYTSNGKKALLITGARQVGKTFIIREFGKRYRSFVEINFLEQIEARELFSRMLKAPPIFSCASPPLRWFL